MSRASGDAVVLSTATSVHLLDVNARGPAHAFRRTIRRTTKARTLRARTRSVRSFPALMALDRAARECADYRLTTQKIAQTWLRKAIGSSLRDPCP
jgi:hypothetical protein